MSFVVCPRAAQPGRVSLALMAFALTACGSTSEQALTANDWVTRGDAAMAADPARALANYKHARSVAGRGGTKTASDDLAPREKRAAQAWLERELASRLTATETPERALGHVDVLRAAARAEGVAEALEPALRSREVAACEALLPRVRASVDAVTASGLGALVTLDALAAAVPARCEALRTSVTRELETKRAALVAGWEGKVRDAGTRPSRALRARLVAAAKSAPRSPDRVPVDPSLGRKYRIAWQVTSAGCPDLDEAFTPLRSARDGDHRGAVRAQLSCNLTESTKDVVEYENVQRTKTEKYTETTQKCSEAYTASGPQQCTEREPSNGVCKRWGNAMQRTSTCHDVPVTKTRTVTVTDRVPRTRKVTVAVATAKGTFEMDVDGTTRSFPLEASSTEASKSAARAAVGRSLTAAVERAAADAKRVLLKEATASLEPKVAAGDVEGALDDATALLGEGATLPPSLADGAARADGLSRDEWTAIVVDQRIPSYPAVSGLRFVEPVPPLPAGAPDPDGVAHDVAAFKKDEAAKAERAELAESNETRLGYALGLNHWDTYGGSGGVGGTLGLALRGGGNDRNPFYFYDGTLDLESNFGAGLAVGADVLLRAGAGLRSKHVWFEPFVVGGVDGRGSDGAALYVPLGLDAGFGARLVLPVTRDVRLELHAARILRPLKETGDSTDSALLQRLLYELRLALSEETAIRGSCSFYQTRASDWVFPTADIRSRACGAGLTLGF